MRTPSSRGLVPRTCFAMIALVALALSPSCKRSASIASTDGAVRAQVPKGDGWTCRPNDVEKDEFRHAGVKCVLDTPEDAIVLNAKLYEVDTREVRTAEVFCVQDWKKAYEKVFERDVRAVATLKRVGLSAIHLRPAPPPPRDTRASLTAPTGGPHATPSAHPPPTDDGLTAEERASSVPACEIVIEGGTAKGPWRAWELRAPNGRKVLHVSISGAMRSMDKLRGATDAWLDSLRYDLGALPRDPVD